MTWNPELGSDYWERPHGAPGGPGQKMGYEAAAAMMRDCLSCGAEPHQRCIRRTDYGGKRQARPGQSHKVRFSTACREQAHGRPAHWTDDLNNCITCNPPPVPGTYYEDAPPPSRILAGQLLAGFRNEAKGES